jgi:hypothetical protein
MTLIFTDFFWKSNLPRIGTDDRGSNNLNPKKHNRQKNQRRSSAIGEISSKVSRFFLLLTTLLLPCGAQNRYAAIQWPYA